MAWSGPHSIIRPSHPILHPEALFVRVQEPVALEFALDLRPSFAYSDGYVSLRINVLLRKSLSKSKKGNVMEAIARYCHIPSYKQAIASFNIYAHSS